MTRVSTIDIVIVFAYLLGMLLVGFIVKKRANKDTNNYLMANRSLPFFMVFACISAVCLGGGSTLGAAKLGYNSGFGGSWYLVWQGLGMMLLGILLSRKVVRLKVTTLAEVFAMKYGQTARIYSAAIVVIYETILSVAQVISAGTVLSGMTGMDMKWAMLIGGGVGIAYSYLGGMVAITITDFAQWIIMTVGVFAILLPCSIVRAGGISHIVASVPSEYWSFTSLGFKNQIIPQFLLIFLGMFLCQEMWQRMLTAKDEKTSYRATTWGGVYALFWGLVCVFIGICAFVVAPNLSDPQQAFVTMVKASVPVGLSGIIYSGVLSAVMSTLSGPLLASATILTNDVFKPLSKKERTEKQEMKRVHITMACLCVFVLVAAEYIGDIVVAVDVAYAILSGCLFLPLMAVFYWKRGTSKAANVALFASSIVVLVSLAIFGLASIKPISYGVLVCVVLFLVISLVSKPDSDDKMDPRLVEYYKERKNKSKIAEE